MNKAEPPRYRPNSPEPVYAPSAKYMMVLRGSRSVLGITSIALILSSLGLFLQSDRSENWEAMLGTFTVVFLVAFCAGIAHIVIKNNIKRNVPPLHWDHYQSGALFKILLILTVIFVPVLFAGASFQHMINVSLDSVVNEVKDNANS